MAFVEDAANTALLNFCCLSKANAVIYCLHSVTHMYPGVFFYYFIIFICKLYKGKEKDTLYPCVTYKLNTLNVNGMKYFQ